MRWPKTKNQTMIESLGSIGNMKIAEDCYGQVAPATQSALDELVRRRERTQAKLDDIDAAINALRANPEILRILDLMAKANRG